MTVTTFNQDLMARLASVQNHPVNADRDIVSFAGFMGTRAELMAYVEGVEQRLFDLIGFEAYREFDMGRPDECFSGCEVTRNAA